MLQTLLLLPELRDVAITGSDSDKTTSRSNSPSVMPTLQLVNEEMTTDSGHQSFSNDIDQARVSIKGLTASWTHVSLSLSLCCKDL